MSAEYGLTWLTNIICRLTLGDGVDLASLYAVIVRQLSSCEL